MPAASRSNSTKSSLVVVVVPTAVGWAGSDRGQRASPPHPHGPECLCASCERRHSCVRATLDHRPRSRATCCPTRAASRLRRPAAAAAELCRERVPHVAPALLSNKHARGMPPCNAARRTSGASSAPRSWAGVGFPDGGRVHAECCSILPRARTQSCGSVKCDTFRTTHTAAFILLLTHLAHRERSANTAEQHLLLPPPPSPHLVRARLGQ